MSHCYSLRFHWMLFGVCIFANLRIVEIRDSSFSGCKSVMLNLHVIKNNDIII
jgi:hypothetical protein